MINERKIISFSLTRIKNAQRNRFSRNSIDAFFQLIQIFLIDNAISDWRIAFTNKRLFQIVLELIICIWHPCIVFDIFLELRDILFQDQQHLWELIFSLPMFLRLYLVVRILVLNSQFFQDPSCRSIGSLNRITIDTSFILKSFVTNHPATTLCIIILAFWLQASWILRACERLDTSFVSLIL